MDFGLMDGAGSAAVVAKLRKFVLGLLVLGLAGTGVELVLLGHYDGVWQQIPLALIALALLAISWQLKKPGPASFQAFRVIMALLIIAGVIGVFLHYQGNVEFQMEIDPTQHGSELFWKVMRAKAPPALAPGLMAQLGLLGLIYAFRHPSAGDRADLFTSKGESS